MRTIISSVAFSLLLAVRPVIGATNTDALRANPSLRTATARDIKCAQLVVDTVNAISSNTLDEKLLKTTRTILEKSIHFRPFLEWTMTLQQISRISSTVDLIKTCPTNVIPAPLTPMRAKLDRLTQQYCQARLLTLIEAELSSGLNIALSEKLAYIEQNVPLFLGDPLVDRFALFLKNSSTNQAVFSYLSELISMYYLSSDKIPPSSILSLIEISPAITKHVQTKAPFSVHADTVFTAELAGIADNLIRDLRAEAPAIKTIREKTESLFSFYKKNELRFIPNLTENIFTKLGLEFTQCKHYEFAGRAYSVALSLSSSSDDRNDNLFGLLWISITQRRPDLALADALSLKLMDNFSGLEPRLQFWIAFSLQETGQRSLARLYYETIIRGAPLSYYAIMSGKKLGELTGAAESTGSLPKSVQSEFRKGSTSSLPAEILREEFSSGLLRLSCWSSLGNQPLFDLETNELLHSGKEAALKPDFAKSIDEKSFREKRLLLLADLLARNKNYIASFRIIQAGLSGREIIPSNDILKTLFPLPIYVHAIGKMTADIDPVVILSLIRQESAFNPAARSPAGARGLMQIMPQTARRLSKKVNRRDLYLPNTNIKLGVSYFKGLLKKYDGNLVYALMAYNAGEHRVATWIRRDVLSSHSILHTIESIPYKETQNYVKLILRNLFFYKYLVNGEGVDDMAIGKIFDVSRVPAKEN